MNARGWEARLKGWHTEYERDGRGVIAPCPAPVKVLRTHGKTFTACWSAKGAVDFVGAIDGRGVFFDAKHCAGKRWSLRGRGGLEPHQERQLRHAAESRSVAFVALWMEAAGAGYIVPIGEITNSVRKSWALADVEQLALPMRDNGWIDVLFPAS